MKKLKQERWHMGYFYILSDSLCNGYNLPFSQDHIAPNLWVWAVNEIKNIE